MDTITNIDVVILGSGSAALAAASEVRRVTRSFVIISNGQYGTTCVRSGCMPSKLLIQGAEFFDQRHVMARYGITGAADLSIDRRALMAYLREMREHFLQATLKTTEKFRDHIVEGEPHFLSYSDVRVNATVYKAKRVIIATGSSPILPPGCEALGDRVLTSDTVFEQETLPDSIAVLGMSVLGAEMADAFARLGITVTAAQEGGMIGGLTDPRVNAYAVENMRGRMTLWLDSTPRLAAHERGVAMICKDTAIASKAFVAVSRKSNICNMGLEALGVIEKGKCIVDYDKETMQVKDWPIFVAGDVKEGRSILNEALDEGKIAGFNAAHEHVTRFKRRTPLQIVYTDPGMAIAGKAFKELPEHAITGNARFDDQGRAKVMGQPHGVLHVYADGESGQLLGSEMFVPEAEHLAHLLAWIIDRKLTVQDALQLPFYHPTLEEGIKTALADLARQIPVRRNLAG